MLSVLLCKTVCTRAQRLEYVKFSFPWAQSTKSHETKHAFLFTKKKKKLLSAVFSCRTVTWSNTGCLTASAKNVMTVVRNSPPSGGGTTVGFVGKSFVVDAAIRKSLENSWATQVGLFTEKQNSLCVFSSGLLHLRYWHLLENAVQGCSGLNNKEK